MANTLFVMEEGGEKVEAGEQRSGKPRLITPNRAQVELRAIDLEGLLAQGHRARVVWEFVEGLELGPLYEEIGSVEGRAGRPATDPRIYMALWLYATIEGIGSARALDRLTREHDAYRWICGGVSVNYHTLSEFRVRHVAYLDAVLTHSVAVLMAEGLVSLERVSQDGVRVRASAGAASFRRKPTLEGCLEAADEQVQALRRELEADPGATSRRQAAARRRASEERQRRVTRALEQMPDAESKKKSGEKETARVSTTDPEARVMKMADGGYRPAFNGQFAVDTQTQVVVGVDVSNSGSDRGKLVPMTEQLAQRYGVTPKQSLVDGGFTGLTDIEGAEALGTTVYAPVSAPRDASRDRYEPLPTDSHPVAQWRRRMGTEEAKEIYKERAATVECVNAHARNRGLQRFLVRGKSKVRAVLLWHGIAQNLMRALALRAIAVQTAA